MRATNGERVYWMNKYAWETVESDEVVARFKTPKSHINIKYY